MRDPLYTIYIVLVIFNLTWYFYDYLFIELIFELHYIIKKMPQKGDAAVVYVETKNYFPTFILARRIFRLRQSY